MPTARRARKGISDAQKQALRVYASETHLHHLREPALNGFNPNLVALLIGLLSQGSFHLNTSILILVQLV